MCYWLGITLFRSSCPQSCTCRSYLDQHGDHLLGCGETKAPSASAVVMSCALLSSTPSLKTTLMFGERNEFGGRAVIVQETSTTQISWMVILAISTFGGRAVIVQETSTTQISWMVILAISTFLIVTHVHYSQATLIAPL